VFAFGARPTFSDIDHELAITCRPSINSCFTHQVLEQLLLPELFAQPGEGQMRPAPLSFVVLAHCDIQARDQFDRWQTRLRMLINLAFLN
jgi:hypothetical protein